MDNITQEEFLEFLATNESLYLPDQEDDTDYWQTVIAYTEWLYTVYSVRPRKTNWLSDVIQKRYEGLLLAGENSATVEDIGIASLELSRIYQTLGAAFEDVPESGPSGQFEEAEAFRKHLSEPAFLEYRRKVAEYGKHAVLDLRDRLRKRHQELSQEENQAARDKLSRLLSSATEILEEIKGAEVRLRDVDKTLKQAEKDAGAAKTAYEAAETASEDAKKQADNILPNVLTILGIFVAVIVAFIGGFFTLILSDRGNISTIPQVCMIHFLMMGHVLVNLIFMFMFMVARLSDKSISVLCLKSTNSKHPGACRECGNQCPIYRRLWRKYPYLVAVNWAAVIGYIVLLLWWYIDTFLYTGLKQWLDSSIVVALCVFLVALASVLFVFVVLPIVGIRRMQAKKGPNIQN